jgi:hypothetical protein
MVVAAAVVVVGGERLEVNFAPRVAVAWQPATFCLHTSCFPSRGALTYLPILDRGCRSAQETAHTTWDAPKDVEWLQ